MSDGVFYNQEVTSETLNEMAVDIGDVTFNEFSDEKFGADLLNSITSSIISQGVLTVGNMCRPVLENNKIYIQTGTIVFESGAKKKITEPVEMQYANNTVIYAYHDILSGQASIVSGDGYPTGGEYVPIAEVDSDGTINDKREVCSAKCSLYTGNQYVEIAWSASSIYTDNFVDLAEFSATEWARNRYIIAGTRFSWKISDIEYGYSYYTKSGVTIKVSETETGVVIRARQESTTSAGGTIVLV